MLSNSCLFLKIWRNLRGVHIKISMCFNCYIKACKWRLIFWINLTLNIYFMSVVYSIKDTSLSIYSANSKVGAKINALTPFYWCFPKWWIIGSEKVRVLPDPVGAKETTLRFSIIKGMPYIWMGVGFLYPAFLRLFTILLLILYLLFKINEVRVGVRVGIITWSFWWSWW